MIITNALKHVYYSVLITYAKMMKNPNANANVSTVGGFQGNSSLYD